MTNEKTPDSAASALSAGLCPVCDGFGVYWNNNSCGGHASQLTVCECKAGKDLVAEAKQRAANRKRPYEA